MFARDDRKRRSFTSVFNANGLKGRLFGGVKVKRARSFSGREKHKIETLKHHKDDTATLSDTEGYHKNRRPRRRTTGGTDIGDHVEKAKMTGFSSEVEGPHGGTLNRQQIIAMVKQRFGLRPEEMRTVTQTTSVSEEAPPAIPPLPPSPSSPKQKRYEELLEKPGAYPTLPRKEETPHPVNTPGVVYLQLGDEIKRAMIPKNLDGVDEVRGLFKSAFTEKYQNEVNNNSKRKTIYIKDPTCGIFYELDDVSDLSNKSHLKILDTPPAKPAPPVAPKPHATHVTKQLTSTPLPNHSHVVPSDSIKGGDYKWTSTVTETRVVDSKPVSVTHTAVSQGSLMDKKKVPLPGLGAQLKPHEKRAHYDPMEQQLDKLTTMLQDALNTSESMDNMPSRGVDGSASSSQSSFVDHGPAAEGNIPYAMWSDRGRMRSDSGTESMSDTSPTPPEVKPKPPPRMSSHGVSRESSVKYSQTLQREPPQPPQRSVPYHYGTLPLATSSPRHMPQRTLSADSPAASLAGSSTLPVGAKVKFQGVEAKPGVNQQELAHRARELKSNVVTLKSELGQLKQLHTFQAKSFEELMSNAKEHILSSMMKLTSGNKPERMILACSRCLDVSNAALRGAGKELRQGYLLASPNADNPGRADQNRIRTEEMTYVRAKNDINRSISELESEVEMVRLDVIQRRHISNKAEIESLNNQLAIISRQIADLKSQYADLHDSMKAVMASELDTIVQGDKFLKEEPSKLDNLVSRCKHVTGTLFTLQKLIAAQDQMKSESQLSFSSLDDVDKELLDSIRSSHLTKPTSPPVAQEDPRSSRGRPRVRFNDQVDYGR
ncbi:coiled-coil domain-containing protein AGAP005037 isoform X6 [Nematostella vectensis]|uniref:coiled-coil domain-containing protein AGAP005037 isoform X6 n=1 Tax=Nematostella vectensis TaxID=45351 RepID=UPI00138FB6E3|nr:coiled-coil domain-containing protein AGAP005037 isoform X6 [Nematostella vectensis]